MLLFFCTGGTDHVVVLADLSAVRALTECTLPSCRKAQEVDIAQSRSAVVLLDVTGPKETLATLNRRCRMDRQTSHSLHMRNLVCVGVQHSEMTCSFRLGAGMSDS